MDRAIRHYLTVTAGYWAFTITDGAIRMLVVLYFHQLGYSPFEVAMLFLFYEIFGVVTNLVGGWLGARIGLNLTMQIGMALQVLALLLLTVPDGWLSVAWVMFAQALSGIAKDLNKMSAKATVKYIAGGVDDSRRLFRYVAVLTGSKNALKGGGFFVGAALLQWIGFRDALLVLAAMLALVLVAMVVLLPTGVGRMRSKPRFSQVFSNNAAINWLSAARFFLFGARDVWFVVGLPVFLTAELGWSAMRVGAFIALWVVGYGVVQALAPRLLRRSHHGHHGQAPGGGSARWWALMLLTAPVAIAIALGQGWPPGPVLIIGLIGFGALFAINSALHSYLILAYSSTDKVAMTVGFYYMANAGGRLTGTVLSGLIYQTQGLVGCLWWSAGFVFMALLLSLPLPSLGDDGEPGSERNNTGVA